MEFNYLKIGRWSIHYQNGCMFALYRKSTFFKKKFGLRRWCFLKEKKEAAIAAFKKTKGKRVKAPEGESILRHPEAYTAAPVER